MGRELPWANEREAEAKILLETRAKIYEHDHQSLQYQDRLRWNRFQTAAVVEGALLAALYSPPTSDFREIRSLVVGGAAVLVLLICMLAVKDSLDGRRHLQRISDFERAFPLPACVWSKFPSGFALMIVIAIGLAAFNLLLFVTSLAAS